MVATDVPRLFELIERSIPLFGPYDNIKRAASHHVIGASMMPIVFRLGATWLDSRVNLMAVMPTGHGKGELKTAVKTYSHAIDMDWVEPTSLYSEQLIGTMVKTTNDDGETVWTPVYGHLASDFLSFEEAYSILADPRMGVTRSHINIALDPYGRNQITKRRVSEERALKYYPVCSVAMFWQPQPILMDVWRGGLARRFLWVTLDELTEQDNLTILEEAIDRPPSSVNSEAVVMLSKIRQRPGNGSHGNDDLERGRFSVNFHDVKSDLLRTTHECLRLMGEESQRCASLVPTMKFTVLHTLMKFAANYTVSRYVGDVDVLPPNLRVSVVDVLLSREDAIDFMPHMVRFLDRHIQMSLSASPIGHAILALLHNHGAMEEVNVIDNLEVSGQMGRYTDEDVRRELRILTLSGSVWSDEQGCYHAIDPIL